MMPTTKTVSLQTFGQVVLDASGNGTVKLAPTQGVVWRLNIASVKTSTSVRIPVCNVFIGANPIDANFIDGTFTGNADSTDSVAGIPIRAGSYIIAVWTGGDVGATATLTITGEQDIPT